MSKARGQTLQQRLGFQDSDLNTPQHDQIMVWLDTNLLFVAKQLTSFSSQWPDELVKQKRDAAYKDVQGKRQSALDSIASWQDSIEKWKDERYYKNQLREAEERLGKIEAWDGLGSAPVPIIEVTERIWEAPVVSPGYRSKYIVGFIDLYAEITASRLDIHSDGNTLPSWTNYGHSQSFCFEIKSSIPSLGEVIRQIRMYQEYQKGRYVVVCPDDRFAEPLKAQGIEFLKYERGGE
jgi:hypothetical protein